MRILHVNSAQSFGGGERHLVDLALGLVARNHEVHVATRPNSALRRALEEHAKIVVLPLPLRNALDVVSLLGIASYVRRCRIEIIHAHTARDYTICALASRFFNDTPLVITRHLVLPMKRLQRITFLAARKVICVSEAVAGVLREGRMVPAEKIVVIHNGIAAIQRDDKFQTHAACVYRKDFVDAEDSLLIGTVGELCSHKGHADFLRAAQIIAHHRDDVRFIIAGEDASPTQHYRALLEKQADALGLTGKLRFLGWIKDMQGFYAALDIFVSASHTESFGLAIAEAMASGNSTIVATQTDGARLMIEDNMTGILVPINNPQAIAAASLSLLNDGVLRKQLAQRARVAVMENYSLDRMVVAVEAVYNQLHA